MKPDIRWQLILALLCGGLLITLFVLQNRPEAEAQTSPPTVEATVQSPALQNDETASCVDIGVAEGGLLIEGVVGAPQYLNPLLSDRNPVDATLADLIFDGLLQYDQTGRLVPALASDWTVSEDGRTVTFTLRNDVVWHDGEPFTAADVAFSYGLMQDDALPSAPQEKALWQSVEISVVDAQTIAFTLPNPYSPFLAATTRGIVPQHILGELSAAEIVSAPFNRQPIGTGPFAVVNNWQADGQLLLQPHPSNGQTWLLGGVAYRFYSDEDAVLAAFAANEINGLQQVTPDMVTAVVDLPGVQLYTSPANSYTQLLFNVSNNGSAASRDLAVRQALQQAIDKGQLIDAAVNGQALPFAGPYLPTAFAYAPNAEAGSADTAAAVELLDAAGWQPPTDLPEGVRIRLADAEDEEAEDEPLALTVVALDTAANRSLVNELARQWELVGAAVEPRFVTAELFPNILSTRDFDVALVEVTPAGDPDLYDFWSQEAIVRGQNYAGWNSRRASEALEAARQVWNQDERLAFYRAFLDFYGDDVPAITLFQPVDSYGLSDEIRNVDIGLIHRPRSRYQTIASWFVADEALLETLAECVSER